MSILFRYRKLNLEATLRVDADELQSLARDLHSSALEEVSICGDDVPADLVWRADSERGWRILLKGRDWLGIAMESEELYLQSDSLLDDLVRERLSGCPLLHAGAVVDPRGRGVMICGSSGAGKTSLVLSSVLRGWDWLSDELLCFRQPDVQAMEGFRRNFNLKERSFAEFPQTDGLDGCREFAVSDSRRRIRFLNPDALHCGKHAPSAKIHVCVVPEFSSEAEPPEAVPLASSEFVRHLASELRTADVATFAWLAEIGRSVPAFTLRYRTPASAFNCLAKLLERL